MCVTKSTATAMIGFREKERTREIRRLTWARAAILFLWVILVFALISLFFSINRESNSTTVSRNHSIWPSTLPRSSRLLRERSSSFQKALFHAPSTSTTTDHHQANRFVRSSKNGDPENTLYGDDKRLIHTGPNPLHN